MSYQTGSSASNTFPAVAPASLAARRVALTIGIALFVGFCTVVGFSRVSLPLFNDFTPLYELTFALVCLVAAGFLVFGFRRSRLRAAVVLASGYLFTSLLTVPRMLTLPGVFSSTGLLGAGPEASAWLDIFRQAGFPLFVTCYALVKRGEIERRRPHSGTRADVILAGAGVVAGVFLLTVLATSGHRLLPRIPGADGYGIALLVANLVVVLIGLAALAVLGWRKPYSILDLWLLVVVCAWIFAALLNAAGNPERIDIGFFTGRLYGLFAVSVAPVVLFVSASRFVGLLDETIAELARSREELARAQRFEAMGQLTGGVAHDFNNLLTAIVGNLDLILEARGDAGRIERLAGNAMKAANRGERLVRQLLTYARKQIDHPQTVNLNELIANLENLILRVIGEQVEVGTKLASTVALVQIDPAQFETAILNLVINARDAMEHGGRITIETRNVIVEQQDVVADPEATPGAYVMVAVSDSGAGMAAEVVAKAFDPFFTTKELGKGSGLGLSQVYGCIKTAGGHIRIRSQLGVGTTVELYLPHSTDESALPAPQVKLAPSRQSGGRETILVVEDDEEVLAVTVENLAGLGYRVLTAVNAPEALVILGNHQQVDVLFSDVIMPGGINGVQLAVEARRVHPDLKVVLTSGYTAAALNLEHGLPKDLTLVNKPYHREEVAETLRALLGQS
jgi:signal transduction histidine kinase